MSGAGPGDGGVTIDVDSRCVGCAARPAWADGVLSYHPLLATRAETGSGGPPAEGGSRGATSVSCCGRVRRAGARGPITQADSGFYSYNMVRR